MLKHTFIIATLLLATAASCSQDKANDTAPATANNTPKTTATNTPTGAAGTTPTGTATDVAGTGGTAGAAGETAPQTEHEVQAASLAVNRARGDFLAVADVRLNELDKKLAAMKADKAVKKDWAEIDRLRASTEQLRAGVKSNAKLYTLETQTEFESLVSRIDEMLR